MVDLQHNNTQLLQDQTYMHGALALATKAYGLVTPNPYVGAVVVKAGQIIGEGYHRMAGGAHAEIEALTMAGSNAAGATLYVTLEPCCHYGRTAPCTEAITTAKIQRVVSAMEDPNPAVAGKGHRWLMDQGIGVTSNICAAEARFINRVFIHNQYQQRPFISLKSALSLDGKIATQSFDSQWITGAKAREKAHYFRGLSSAIMITKGTLLKDDPELSVRFGYQTHNPPIRVLLLRNFSGINGNFKLFNTQVGPTWILYPTTNPPSTQLKHTLEQQGVHLIPIAEQLTAQRIAETLYAHKCTSILLEGGSVLYGLFIDAKLVDEYLLFYGPRLIGNRQAPGLWDSSTITHLAHAPLLTIVQQERLEESLFIHAKPFNAGG